MKEITANRSIFKPSRLIRKFRRVRSQAVYLIWFYLKIFTFRSKKYRVKTFDAFVNNREVYFTTGKFPGGFSDHLYAFKFLYSIGRNLNLKYYFTPLNAERSNNYYNSKNQKTTSESIFNLLGVNSYLERISDNPAGSDIHRVHIDLDYFQLREKNYQSFEDLIYELKARLYSFIHSKKTTLFYFRASPKTFFRYYRLAAAAPDSDIDYRNLFMSYNQSTTGKSLFSPSEVKLFIHIRQGDTAVLETPWNTYVPVWYNIPGRFTQFKKIEEIQSTHIITLDDFYRFISSFLEHASNKKFSSLLFSDGYKTAFRLIYQNSKKKDISDDELEWLKKAEVNYDNEKYEKFLKFNGMKTIIGEDIEKLYNLIHSFIEADILVIGTQQSMIPKMVAMLSDPKNMPVLIVLYRSDKPHFEYLGLDPFCHHIVYVNIHDYDIHEITQKTMKILSLRRENNA